jgi:hypothetical protein
MAGTHQVHGDPTLRLLGLEDARAMFVISIRGDSKRPFDCDRESCETADKTIPLSVEEPSKVAYLGNNLDPK